MRYVKLLLLYFQDTFVQRARVFVWFLISIFGPLLMILFWRGASYQHTAYSFSNISSYYFLLIIAGSLLMAHPEEWIAENDIHNGYLSNYLLKPFSYFLMNLISELPWGGMRGIFGIITLIIFYFFFKFSINLSISTQTILFSIFISILGFFLGFVYKMCLAMLAFWFTEISGILQLSEIMIFIFAGYIAPLFLFPDFLGRIAAILPFSYIIYFPIISFQVKLNIVDFIRIIAVQTIWILIFFLIYRLLWSKGLKKFTAVGQ